MADPLEQLSTADLKAYSSGDFDKISTPGLQLIKNVKEGEATPTSAVETAIHKYVDAFTGGLADAAIAGQGAAIAHDLGDKGNFKDVYNDLKTQTAAQLNKEEKEHPTASKLGSLIGMGGAAITGNGILNFGPAMEAAAPAAEAATPFAPSSASEIWPAASKEAPSIAKEAPGMLGKAKSTINAVRNNAIVRKIETLGSLYGAGRGAVETAKKIGEYLK